MPCGHIKWGVLCLRKYYIDNLRWADILLLFPYHTAMIYNDWGENFYVRSAPVAAISGFVIATYTWFMPLLFVLSGIGSYWALQKRTPAVYLKERLHKLLLPLVLGVLLIVPVQTYYAERFHNSYTGSYLGQYRLFFSKFNDLTGYTGGFTMGHLWFLWHLFLISLLALPLMHAYLKGTRCLALQKLKLPALLCLFLLPLAATPILEFGGKSFGRFFVLFLLGFFVFSNDAIEELLEKRRWPLFLAFLLLTCAKLVSYFACQFRDGIAVGIFDAAVMWVAILAFLGMAKHSFNQNTPLFRRLSKASFGIYLLHQSCLVAVGYAVLRTVRGVYTQFFLILLGSAVLTFALYGLFWVLPANVLAKHRRR